MLMDYWFMGIWFCMYRTHVVNLVHFTFKTIRSFLQVHRDVNSWAGPWTAIPPPPQEKLMIPQYKRTLVYRSIIFFSFACFILFFFPLLAFYRESFLIKCWEKPWHHNPCDLWPFYFALLKTQRFSSRGLSYEEN